ncbi:MAG: hypothetical protein WA419_11740 [Silvibacterium sp.]
MLPLGARTRECGRDGDEENCELYCRDANAAGRGRDQDGDAEVIGFEQVDEDFYKVYFRDVEIGEFDAEALRFRPVQVMR